MTSHNVERTATLKGAISRLEAIKRAGLVANPQRRALAAAEYSRRLA